MCELKMRTGGNKCLALHRYSSNPTLLSSSMVREDFNVLILLEIWMNDKIKITLKVIHFNIRSLGEWWSFKNHLKSQVSLKIKIVLLRCKNMTFTCLFSLAVAKQVKRVFRKVVNVLRNTKALFSSSKVWVVLHNSGHLRKLIISHGKVPPHRSRQGCEC